MTSHCRGQSRIIKVFSNSSRKKGVGTISGTSVRLPHHGVKRLFGVALVILLLVAGTAMLLPTLRKARMLAQRMAARELSRDMIAGYESPHAAATGRPGGATRAQASIESFVADIDLTPRLSIGTAQPESIYEAAFKADIKAKNPRRATDECEIQLPLPPQLISLSDLNISVNGEPSKDVFVHDGMLVWHGQLPETDAVAIEITYTAVGKGIYTLNTPPGKIVDKFEATLTASGSDLRMMGLSLQPEPPQHKDGKTVYHWNYNRLMIGRPIVIDILGIAPMDRLGELTWLGPISVLVFGLLVAMLTLAYRPEMLDKWMVLLIVGTFAAAYPLMYFAQEFMPLTMAVALAGAGILAIIAARAIMLLSVKVGIFGIGLIGAVVMALTMGAAIHPRLQGILLTLEAVGTAVVLMVLLPKAQKALATVRPVPMPPIQTPAPEARREQPD